MKYKITLPTFVLVTLLAFVSFAQPIAPPGDRLTFDQSAESLDQAQSYARIATSGRSVDFSFQPVEPPSSPTNLRLVPTPPWAPDPDPEPEPEEPEPEPEPTPEPTPEPSPEPEPGRYPYFEALVADPRRVTAFHYRTQADIDVIASRSVNERKIPIVYDPAHDAAKFEIDPSGSLPSSGATGTPQKRFQYTPPAGASSLLIAWDLKIAESMRFKAGAEEQWDQGDGTTRTVRYLTQHKSHRIDDLSGNMWLALKQTYSRGTNTGRGIAEFFLGGVNKHTAGPGTTAGSNARIEPFLADYYVQPDTWTRVWVFIEGDVASPSAPVQMSAWLADEQRPAVQLYDRVNMIAPADGFGRFRFEFDSSTKEALNGPGQQWQRNFIVLHSITYAEMLGLLEQP
jgi:hypothetical protein